VYSSEQKYRVLHGLIGTGSPGPQGIAVQGHVQAKAWVPRATQKGGGIISESIDDYLYDALF
jgi:hypothetical protein